MNSAEYFEEEYQRQMYRRIGCLPILLLCVVLSFVGCKTIHDSELIEIHDTVTVYHGDTLVQYVYKNIGDTVKQIIEKTIIINEKGDTVKQNTTNNYYHNHYESDSVNIYKALLDSIKQSLNTNHEKEKVIEKKDWLSIWKWKLIAFTLLITVILLTLKIIIPKMKKIINKSNI